jgi:hypothetical protein
VKITQLITAADVRGAGWNREQPHQQQIRKKVTALVNITSLG